MTDQAPLRRGERWGIVLLLTMFVLFGCQVVNRWRTWNDAWAILEFMPGRPGRSMAEPIFTRLPMKTIGTTFIRLFLPLFLLHLPIPLRTSPKLRSFPMRFRSHFGI